MIITVTSSAEAYLEKLIQKPEHQGKVLRLEAYPQAAEAGLRFVEMTAELAGDQVVGVGGIQIFIEGSSLKSLQATTIDLRQDALGWELVFETPNLKPVPMPKDQPLEFRVRYLIDTFINPQLSSHGGQVVLVEIRDGCDVVLKFSGGCQGCSMIDQTTKHLVETVLRQHNPEISAVIDITDHDDRRTAYQ